VRFVRFAVDELEFLSRMLFGWARVHASGLVKKGAHETCQALIGTCGGIINQRDGSGFG
jgi:hypothetical protein